MLKIEMGREEDGRWIGEVPALPGVLAYGANEAEARANVIALAFRVIADRIENGEPVPDEARNLFAGVSAWPAAKAGRVLRALQRIGWTVKRQVGSHRVLGRQGWDDYVFAFHDRKELGPAMLGRIAKHTGLRPDDL